MEWAEGIAAVAERGKMLGRVCWCEGDFLAS
jgi:hypothetical protein